MTVVDASGWGGNYNRAAQANVETTVDGIKYGTTTFGEIKDKTLELKGIVFKWLRFLP